MVADYLQDERWWRYEIPRSPLEASTSEVEILSLHGQTSEETT